MKKRVAIVLVPVLALVIIGSVVLFNKESTSVNPIGPTSTPTPTGQIDDEVIDIIDIIDPTGTPQASILPDPFDGFETVNVIADTFSEPDESINVKNFGAIGDGITDDYDAVLNAVDQACEEGKVLYFPAGTYYLSRKLVLNKNISVVGECMDSVTLLFKDEIADGPIQQYNQRGFITFVSDSLDVRGVTFSYSAESISGFTKRKGISGGREGALFSVLKGSNIVFDNCRFKVEEDNSPSVTCLWLKSEAYDINNISISSCEILNNSASTVGGGLWVSAHDNNSRVLRNFELTDSYLFRRGNDEVFSIWGYDIEDVFIHDNSFEFSNHDVQNDILIAFGMPSGTREECLRNVRFSNNTVMLTGQVFRAIGVQRLTADSDVEISDNIIMAAPDDSVSFNCFRIDEPGNVTIKRNSVGVDGGKSVAYMTYSTGKAIFSDNLFKTRNTGTSMLIRSGDSEYCTDVDITFERDTYDLGASNNTSGIPIVQISASGNAVFDSCNIITTESAIHETRFQMLYSRDNGFNYAPNCLTFNNCNFDTTLMLKYSKDSNSSLDILDSNVSCIHFVVEKNIKCLENIKIENTNYNSFKCNWKIVNPSDMSSYCDELQTE